MTKIFLSCTISVGLAPLANYTHENIFNNEKFQIYGNKVRVYGR